MHLRAVIPKHIRLAYKLLHRAVQDREQGWARQFASAGKAQADWVCRLSIQQTILPGAFFENKTANMRLTAASINRIVVLPGQVFSFWSVVGWPNRLRGYRRSRNLIGGKIRFAYGGGICLVSGILYHLSLMAGLEILERHNHSLDIYTEAERFTPLGADATVAYGYKDLRIRNNTEYPICFEIDVTGNQVTAQLKSAGWIKARVVTFERTEMPPTRRVVTLVDGETVTESLYRVI
ncbi:MAG: VanW family protein [Saprospiraceae bacterium]